jgi:PAS domain S-box-containing protein
MEFDLARFALTFVGEAADAIIYADAAGVIHFWNSGAERIFGFATAEAVGQSLDIIIPPNLRERHWAGFRHTIQTGESHYASGDLLSVPAIRNDGRRISVEFTIVPFRDEAEHIVGIAASLRDVTRRFEELKALRKALAATEQT